jgi:ABC-2 type transport system ATP-binding protein
MSAPARALVVRDVTHAYSRRALDGVSFEAAAGEFVVLLGLNGAGKTTLFSLIAGLLNLQRGSIEVLGNRLPQQREEALAATGFVFQQPALDLDLTVAQTLRYHAALHGLPRREAEWRIEEELAKFDLAGRTGDLVRTLSGGQRRRIEIARSLLHRPRLLLLDEPTVGLDVPNRRAILERSRRLCREQDVTVLWATHLLDEVKDGDRIVMIHKGRIARDFACSASNRVADRFAEATTAEAAE